MDQSPVGLIAGVLLFLLPAAVKQLKETVSSSIHKLANFAGKNSAEKLKAQKTTTL